MRVSAQTTNAPKPLITSPIDESKLTVLKGNTYPLARPEYDHGPAPASLPMQRIMLLLKRSPQQEAALGALLDQQQEKGSPNYHKWLTPAEFGQQFGLSNQDIQTIENWLETQGFQIDRVASGRGLIEFSGTAGDVQQAFRTAIHQYVVNEKAHWANASDPEIPTALAPAVAGIVSLNNFPRKPLHRLAGIFRKSKTTGQAVPVQPMYNFSCASGVTCYAVGPYDFATIYNVLPLWNAGIDGTGETIAIVAQSDINPQDVSDFRGMFGLPAENLQIIHDGPDPGILQSTGDEAESDIDVEWAGAVAKNAKIDLVVSESTGASNGVDLSAEYIVDNDLAPILSMSYGGCELDLGTAGNQFYSQLWQQAAAEGITVSVAAGDGGSALCDTSNQGATNGLTVNGTASTPYDIAVGGTDFNDALDPALYWNSTNSTTSQESAKGYIPETTWNDTCTNDELAQLAGSSSNAETNCNDTTLTSRFPFLLDVIGGGGGASNCTTSSGTLASCGGGYAKTSWQTGTGVPGDGKRDLPDVSLFAGDGFNGNFYIACDADAQGGTPCALSGANFLGVGGTSVSAQAFAGVMALVNQKTGVRQGDANYVFYPLAAQPGASCDSSGTLSSSCIFYDVTLVTNAMPCATGSPDCTTNTAGDKYGVLSGYGATTGYDLATGLGSMDVANLANGWTSVKFQPTSTTLSLDGGSAVDITHGTPVSVDVSVSPASPVPTGNVSLIATPAGNSVDAGTFTLSNGAVSSSTSLLPGGTSYNVFAHYAGNGTYAASDSSPVTVTVNPEASQTFANLETFNINGNLTSHSATSATYGNGYYLFRLDVGNSSATYSPTTGISSTCSNQTANCPTGTVTVTANGSPLAGNPFALNAQGYAEDQSILVPGTYAISANYSGDSSYSPSTGTADITINKAQTTEPSPGVGLPVQYGNPERIEQELLTTSDGAKPTGTFTFFLDGSPLAVSNLTYQGSAYQPNTSPPAYAYLNGIGDVVFLSLGSHSLITQYSGDTNYAPATSSASDFTVVQARPGFGNLETNPSPVQPNQPATLTIKMCGSVAGVAPTGTITFYDSATAIPGTVSYTSSGPIASQCSYLQASLVWTSTTLGSHFISARYSGDTYYTSASSPSTTADVQAPTTLSLSSSSPTFEAGQSVTLTAQVTSTLSGGPAPAGMVEFLVSGVALGNSSPLNSSGQAQITTDFRGVYGSDVTVDAVYAGDPNYDGSTGSITLTDLTDFAISLSPNPPNILISNPGGSGTATLTVNAAGGYTGTVSFAGTCPRGDEITCSFNPSYVTLSSTNTAASTTFTVSTTAPSMLAPADWPSDLGWPGAAAALTLASLLCLAMLRLRKPEHRWSTALGLLVLYSVLALASCGGGTGGGSGNPPPPSNLGTPPGTYSVVLTGTDGILSHSVTLNVNVQ